MTEQEAITWARRYATYALLERLKPNDPNNDKVRARVARIRAELLDTAPEVRSVLLYLNENVVRQPPADAAKLDLDEALEFVATCPDLGELRRLSEAIRARVAGIADDLERGGIIN